MAHPELYLNLNYNQKIIFAILLIAAVILIQIIARTKNKAKKTHRKQVNKKITFTVDCEEFMKKYFKEQEFLYENKNRQAELRRLLNY